MRLSLVAVAGCAASAPPNVSTSVPPEMPLDRSTPTALDAPGLVRQYQATITPEELAGHLYVYADDFLRGRDTGAPGQRFAARYLAGQYQAMGVAPKGTGADNGTLGLDPYLQPFELERSQMTSQTITVRRGGEAVLTSRLVEGATDVPLVPLYGEVTDASAAPVVFVGYGTDAERAGLDLDGAYVLMLSGTPEDPGDRSQLQPRAVAAGAAGARAVVVTLGPVAEALITRAQGALRGGRLALPDVGGDAAEGGLPPLFATGLDVVATLLGQPGATATPGATDLTMMVETERVTETVPTENVLAFIEGSDLRDEVVVISAHLDHIGVEEGAAEDAAGDVIHNGADDDGSGTVALLEIAEAFKAAQDAGHGPRRSLLFLHVTGEEKGLLGSAYYADREPVLPLAQTVANLNVDMIGRRDPSYAGRDTPYVYIIGAELISTDLDAINTDVNAATGLDLDLSKRYNHPDDPNRFFARSDHWNFGKHDVPFIFYFTGTHEDYHEVGDEAHKIDYPRLAQISRLIFGTAWQLATQDARPAVSGVGFAP